MSQKHPVIAVTGSSGAGTSTVKNSFEHIFHREELSAVVVEGDSFHRYDRDARSIARPAKVKLACICTMMMRLHHTSKKPAPLPHGRHLSPVQTCCFTRDYMAGSRATPLMSPSMWTCW